MLKINLRQLRQIWPAYQNYWNSGWLNIFLLNDARLYKIAL